MQKISVYIVQQGVACIGNKLVVFCVISVIPRLESALTLGLLLLFYFRLTNQPKL